MDNVAQVASQGIMKTGDWVLIFTTLFLGIVAFSVPYVAEWIKRKFYAPELYMGFHQVPRDCHITRNKSVDLSGRIVSDEPTFYFRFKVSNKGKTQARRCEAVVEKLSVADSSGNYIPYSRYTPVALIWGSSYGEFIDINPGRLFYCDLCHIPTKKDQHNNMLQNRYVNPAESGNFDLGVILNVKAAFYSQPNRLPPGKYKLDVAIYSENSETIRGFFLVSWSGTWKDTEENLFKEVIISFNSV